MSHDECLDKQTGYCVKISSQSTICKIIDSKYPFCLDLKSYYLGMATQSLCKSEKYECLNLNLKDITNSNTENCVNIYDDYKCLDFP